jgi:glycosyltransferase involved in cell wall biosynthesis
MRILPQGSVWCEMLQRTLPTGRHLRILTTIHSFDPGGVERVALRLCEWWKFEGADVRVLIGRRTGAMAGQAPCLNYVGYSSGPVGTARVETLWMIMSLWRQVRAAPPDVIFCPGNTYAIVVVALRLILGRRCPPVVAKISNSLVRKDMAPPFGWAYRAWLAVQGRLIDAFVAMAPSLRHEALDSMRVSPGRVTVIEDPALSAADFDRLAGSRQRIGADGGHGRLFVSAGRLVRQKRFDRLLRAFAEGGRDGDRLVILGEGPFRPRLAKLTRALGLETRVDMPGHTEDLADWLSRADAFLLASDYEGVPAALVEALAAGLPIIATDSSAAIAELAGNGRFGQVVARDDARELARAIREFDPSAFDFAGAKRHSENFQVGRAGPAYLSLMAATCARRLETGNLAIADAPNFGSPLAGVGTGGS